MKYLLLCLSFFSLSLLSAQHGTLLGRSPLNGAFGAPIYEFGFNSNDDRVGGIGGGGGLVFRNFFLGAYGVGSNDALTQLLEDGEISSMELSHGGLWLGVTPFTYSVIHPYLSARAGWGVLDLEFSDPNLEFADLDQVFVVTPEAGLELNVTRWFRIAATGSYRIVRGVNDDTPSSVTNSLEGFQGGITLRFGWFGSGNDRRWSSHSSWD